MTDDEEYRRQASLRRLQVLDTEAEPEFEGVVELASGIFDAPIALVSLIDAERQWFKAKLGLEPAETSRCLAFCSRAIQEPEHVLVIPDATKDPRVADSPLVTDAPHIRFYAGAPIVLSNGAALGTVCVIDSEPHPNARDDHDRLRKLAHLAHLVGRLLDGRLHERMVPSERHAKLHRQLDVVERISAEIRELDAATKTLTRTAPERDVRAVRQVCDDLQDLVSDLNRASTVEASVIALNPAIVPLAEPLTAAVEGLAQHAKSHGVTLAVQPPPPDATTQADPNRLAMVLRSAIMNAIDATPEGGTVTIEPFMDDRWLELKVHDAGTPVTDQEVADALRPLYTGPIFAGPRSAGADGPLGALLDYHGANRLIEAQSGMIDLYASANGSTLWLALPRVKP